MLEPIAPGHADVLFPLVFQTAVTDTLLWDGPSSLADMRARFAVHAQRPTGVLPRVFAIVHEGEVVGCCDLREVRGDYRLGIGLYVGIPHQGRGFATRAIADLLAFAFALPSCVKVEAGVFVGNHASRRALEKNGFTLEGTLRHAVKKRGVLLDEWLLGITRSSYGELGPAP